MSPLKENIFTDIEEFIQINGKKILAQTTEYSDYQNTIDLVETINSKYGNIADLGIGLHPSRFEEGILNNEFEETEIFKYGQKQFDIFKDVFEKNSNKVTAIGECGLDYFGMYQYNQFNLNQQEELKEVQRRIFTKICKLAIKYSLPLSIHSRDIDNLDECTKDTLTILAKEGKGILKGVFHSFTGSKKMLLKILDMDMYIGFNGILTYPSGENVRELLKETPIERILFETDGPFLPTQSIRKNKKSLKRYGRPVLINEIVRKASEIKNIGYERVERITDENYLNLFSKSN